MCVDESPSQYNPHRVLYDVGPVEEVLLDPVDAVTVTTVMDNSLDLFMPDQGVAHRAAPQMSPWVPCAVMTDRQVPDALIAEHGFSALVTVTKGESRWHVLFDAGASPNGVVENMRRLDINPADIQAIVCSHGHFDRTAGLAGLLRVLGSSRMPVVIHPHFWRRRRLMFPGRDPMELPTMSVSALRDGGFDVVEAAEPSFVLDDSVLITGEVPRVSGYEPGFPIQQGVVRQLMAAGSARLGRSGVDRERPRQGSGGHYRLRPCRGGEYQPLRDPAHRRPATFGVDRRFPPQRPAVRTTDPAGSGGPCGACADALHRLARPTRDGRPLR
jgi:metal-dependent hydrolase (beta-lactamase superfamily II)